MSVKFWCKYRYSNSLPANIYVYRLSKWEYISISNTRLAPAHSCVLEPAHTHTSDRRLTMLTFSDCNCCDKRTCIHNWRQIRQCRDVIIERIYKWSLCYFLMGSLTLWQWPQSCLKWNWPFWFQNVYSYRTQVSLGSDLWVLMSVSTTPFADLTDVTLADEESNSIPTDDVNGQSQAM